MDDLALVLEQLNGRVEHLEGRLERARLYCQAQAERIAELEGDIAQLEAVQQKHGLSIHVAGGALLGARDLN